MSTILVVDDDPNLRRLLQAALEDQHTVRQAASGQEALDCFAEQSYDLVLLDLILPDFNGLQVLRQMKDQAPDVPVIIMTAQSDVRAAVDAMKAHAADYLIKPFDLDELRLVAQRTLEFSALAMKHQRLQQQKEEQSVTAQITGDSPKAGQLRQLIARLAQSEARCVLVSGESGTGKELVARGLHYQSPRHAHPLVEVNCAGFSPTLFESELFGHERGAFTHATTTKKGLVEVADKGTLFLDEIGEIPFSVQAKFLRFLEDRHFRRVGGTQDLTTDLRLVAATNSDLSAMVMAGTFRKDLYYRLAVMTVELPPLLDRHSDIPALARYFLDEANRKFGKAIPGLTPEADQFLAAYAWPGNARELRNVIERIVLLDGDGPIAPHQLPPEISGAECATPPSPDGVGCLFPATLEKVQQSYAVAVLRRVNGNKTKAAEILGVSRQTLRAWIGSAA